jgi:hypothetical protein
VRATPKKRADVFMAETGGKLNDMSQQANRAKKERKKERNTRSPSN